jgi:hypothetical protein
MNTDFSSAATQKIFRNQSVVIQLAEREHRAVLRQRVSRCWDLLQQQQQHGRERAETPVTSPDAVREK